MMTSDDFEVGRIYFRLQTAAQPVISHVISSWIFEGREANAREEKPGTTSSSWSYPFCEWESWVLQHRAPRPGEITGVAFASLEDAQANMITWETLLQRISTMQKFEETAKHRRAMWPICRMRSDRHR